LSRRLYIAIGMLTIAVALSLVQANANLYTPLPSNGVLPGFGTNTAVYNSGPTQAQKDEALQIAATSPLCKQYNAYPDESWRCAWNSSPSDGHTVDVFTALPDGTNFLYITVDLNTHSVVYAQNEPSIGYSDQASEYTNPDTSMLSMPNIFTSTPSIGTGNSPFNILSSSPLTDNSEVQPSSATSGSSMTSGLSLPFSMFSKGFNAFPSMDSGLQVFSPVISDTLPGEI